MIPSALVRDRITNQRGKIIATLTKRNDSKAHTALVQLEDGSRVFRTRDELEVAL